MPLPIIRAYTALIDKVLSNRANACTRGGLCTAAAAVLLVLSVYLHERLIERGITAAPIALSWIRSLRGPAAATYQQAPIEMP